MISETADRPFSQPFRADVVLGTVAVDRILYRVVHSVFKRYMQRDDQRATRQLIGHIHGGSDMDTKTLHQQRITPTARIGARVLMRTA